jgi:hypothetical protein
MQGINGVATMQTPLAPIACASAAAVASQNAQNLQKVYENATKTPSSTPNTTTATVQATSVCSNTGINDSSRSESTNGTTTKSSATQLGPSSAKDDTVSTSVAKPRASGETATSAPLCSKSTISATPASVPNLGEMSDFLSAFDKVTGRSLGGSSAPAQVTSNEYSPTFTTESFDDLHRFLGMDLSPVTTPKGLVNNVPISRGTPVIPMPSPVEAQDPAAQELPAAQLPPEEVAKMRQPNQSNETMETEKPPQLSYTSYTSLLSEAYTEAMLKRKQEEKSGPLGADSYSIFAQQSAFAASQHSAYTSIKKDGPRNDFHRATVLQQAPAMQNGSFRSVSNPSEVTEHFNASVQVPAQTRQSQIQQIEAWSASHRGLFRNSLERTSVNQNMANHNVDNERTLHNLSEQGMVPNSSLQAMPNPNVVSEPSNASSDQDRRKRRIPYGG